MKIKTDYIYNKVCSTALMMLCCVAFFSCTKVDVCRDRTHSHLGKISLVYEWSNIADSLRPDSMLVLVSQVVNSHRMGYVTDSTDSEGGRYRFGKMSDDVEANVENEVLMASAGDYSVYAFNHDVNAKGAMFCFDNLEAYSDGQHLGVVGIQDLTMSYVGYKLGEIDSYGKEWVSINPGFDYISTGVEPIYFATNNSRTSAKEHTFSVHEGSETRIHVYPRKITQDITFSIPVYVECVDEDNFVSVDEVIAEVSGIPYKVKPYSGELNVDTICKLLFKMELDTVSERCIIGDESKTFLKYDCKSTISVTGLLANKNNEGCVGAGILQLCLYTRNIKDGDTIDMAPRYACINLYHTLDSANLVIEKEDSLDSRKSYFIRRTDKGTLDIKNGLMLTDEELMQYPQEGNASRDSWFVF